MLYLIAFFIIICITFCIYKCISYLLKFLNRDNGNIIKSKTIFTLLISFCLAFSITYYWLFTSHSVNYKKAKIERKENLFVIILYGERELKSHDPLSYLKRATYIDSIKLEVPKRQGVIISKDVEAPNTYFDFIKGDLVIVNNDLKIDLFYIDNFYKKMTAFKWNGDYIIE